MSTDIYDLTCEGFRTEMVERYCQDLINESSDGTLESIVKNKPRIQDRECLRYYYALCLVKLDQDSMNEDFSASKIIDECYELFDYAPEYTETIAGTIDNILINAIIKCKNEEEILQWSSRASKLSVYSSQPPSSISAAYSKIMTMIYKQLSVITEKPTRNKFITILDHFSRGIKFGIGFSSLAKMVAENSLTFIEEKNNIDKDEEIVAKPNPKKDMEIVGYIEEIKVSDPSVLERLQVIKNLLSQLVPVEILRKEENKSTIVEIKTPDTIIDYNDLVMLKEIWKNRHEKFIMNLYLAKYKGKDVAVKKYSTESIEYLSRFSEEIYINEKLSSMKTKMNCFLKYYGSFKRSTETEYEIGLVMEYHEKNLMNFLNEQKQKKEPINESVIIDMYKTLIVSFSSMHDQKIYHLDIKPQNILIDENKNLFIIDFGSATVNRIDEYDSEIEYKIQGTKGYMSPELLEKLKKKKSGANYSMEKADVFSLGMTLLQMSTCEDLDRKLNRKENNETLLSYIKNVPYKWADPILRKMLQVNPANRPTAKELLKEIINIETVTFSRSNH